MYPGETGDPPAPAEMVGPCEHNVECPVCHFRISVQPCGHRLSQPPLSYRIAVNGPLEIR